MTQRIGSEQLYAFVPLGRLDLLRTRILSCRHQTSKGNLSIDEKHVGIIGSKEYRVNL